MESEVSGINTLIATTLQIIFRLRWVLGKDGLFCALHIYMAI
jgi:hypothetical protein